MVLLLRSFRVLDDEDDNGIEKRRSAHHERYQHANNDGNRGSGNDDNNKREERNEKHARLSRPTPLPPSPQRQLISLLAEEDQRGRGAEKNHVAVGKVRLEGLGDPVPLRRAHEGAVLPGGLGGLGPFQCDEKHTHQDHQGGGGDGGVLVKKVEALLYKFSPCTYVSYLCLSLPLLLNTPNAPSISSHLFIFSSPAPRTFYTKLLLPLPSPSCGLFERHGNTRACTHLRTCGGYARPCCPS